jgi:hypothetical protein
LFESNLRRNIVLPARNVTFLSITKNVTNYTIIQNQVVNRSLSVEEIERSVKRSIPRYRVVDHDTVPAARDRVRGNEIKMYRHQLDEAAPTRTPPRAEPSRPMEREGRRPGVGTPSGQRASQQEILQRQESERRQLNKRHQEERTKLEETHLKERERPPTWVPPQESRRQHEAERRALDEQQEQEKRSLQQRHEREQKGEGRSR